jgi:hypothetical protein
VTTATPLRRVDVAGCHVAEDVTAQGIKWRHYHQRPHSHSWVSGFDTFEAARDDLAAKLDREGRAAVAAQVRETSL